MNINEFVKLIVSRLSPESGFRFEGSKTRQTLTVDYGSQPRIMTVKQLWDILNSIEHQERTIAAEVIEVAIPKSKSSTMELTIKFTI